jgi:RNA polymerase sigma-70 factor (ECF subfamily)
LSKEHAYTDQELVLNLKKGDRVAFDLLFYKYYKLLLGNALLIVEDEYCAKDIVQNFFIDFWQKKIYEHLEGDIKGYLFKSVYNSSLNYLKQKKNYQKHISNYQNRIPVVIYQKELTGLQSELSPIISEFPVQQKRAFTLVYMLQLKYEEAAQEMGVSINTIKTHLKNSLVLLRKHKNNFR